jgi:hypothetical protein
MGGVCTGGVKRCVYVFKADTKSNGFLPPRGCFWCTQIAYLSQFALKICEGLIKFLPKKMSRSLVKVSRNFLLIFLKKPAVSTYLSPIG